MNRFFYMSGGIVRISFLALTLLMVLSIAALSCGDDEEDKTTTSTTPEYFTPDSASPSGGSGSEPGGGTTTGDDAALDGDGGDVDGDSPTLVNTTDTYGPCIDGMQQVTHYTEYSDGSAASSVAMVPCGDDIVPVEP